MIDILAGLIPEDEEKTPDGPTLDFKVNTNDFSTALAAVESVVPSRDLNPVLKNVAFKVDDGKLRITATDGGTSMVSYCPVAQTNIPGHALFPATRMVSLAREASAGSQLHIRVMSKNNSHSVVVKSGSATWKFSLENLDFPDFTLEEGYGLVPVERKGFLDALKQVNKAVSTDPMRPAYLMMVDVSNGKVRACDSTRFQQVKYAFPFDCQISVPAVAELIKRMSSSNAEHISVGTTEKSLLFKIGETLMISQRIFLTFPNLDETMLKPALANDQELHVNRVALMKAVRRVRITADDMTSAVVLSLNSGSVSVESKDRHGGTAVESVEATWNHPPRHVSFNHKHLSDMLSSATSDDCVLRFGKDLKTRPSPVVMEDEQNVFTAVLSQIRLDWL